MQKLSFDYYKKKNEKKPMRKVSTLVQSTLKINSQKVSTVSAMNPSETTVNKILQFAASYRVEKVSENEFVELLLN